MGDNDPFSFLVLLPGEVSRSPRLAALKPDTQSARDFGGLFHCINCLQEFWLKIRTEQSLLHVVRSRSFPSSVSMEDLQLCLAEEVVVPAPRKEIRDTGAEWTRNGPG